MRASSAYAKLSAPLSRIKIAVDREVAVDRRERDVVVVVLLHRAAGIPRSGRRVAASIACVMSFGFGKNITPSCTSGVPSCTPCASGRVQTSRSCATLRLLICVERAIAPVIQRAAPRQPIGGVGVLQHRVGDGPQRALLRAGGRAGERAEQRGANVSGLGRRSGRMRAPSSNQTCWAAGVPAAGCGDVAGDETVLRHERHQHRRSEQDGGRGVERVVVAQVGRRLAKFGRPQMPTAEPK